MPTDQGDVHEKKTVDFKHTDIRMSYQQDVFRKHSYNDCKAWRDRQIKKYVYQITFLIQAPSVQVSDTQLSKKIIQPH